MKILDVSLPVWLVLAIAMIGLAVLYRRAYKRAAQDARLDALRGNPPMRCRR
jgi:hypothetical protein